MSEVSNFARIRSQLALKFQNILNYEYKSHKQIHDKQENDMSNWGIEWAPCIADVNCSGTSERSVKISRAAAAVRAVTAGAVHCSPVQWTRPSAAYRGQPAVAVRFVLCLVPLILFRAGRTDCAARAGGFAAGSLGTSSVRCSRDTALLSFHLSAADTQATLK